MECKRQISAETLRSVTLCFVPQCGHFTNLSECEFYKFPEDPKLCSKWIKLIRRGDRGPSRESRICSCHFENRKKTSLPSIFPWQPDYRAKIEETKRAEKRRRNEDTSTEDSLSEDDVIPVKRLLSNKNASSSLNLTDSLSEQFDTGSSVSMIRSAKEIIASLFDSSLQNNASSAQNPVIKKPAEQISIEKQKPLNTSQGNLSPDELIPLNLLEQNVSLLKQSETFFNSLKKHPVEEILTEANVSLEQEDPVTLNSLIGSTDKEILSDQNGSSSKKGSISLHSFLKNDIEISLDQNVDLTSCLNGSKLSHDSVSYQQKVPSAASLNAVKSNVSSIRETFDPNLFKQEKALIVNFNSIQPKLSSVDEIPLSSITVKQNSSPAKSVNSTQQNRSFVKEISLLSKSTQHGMDLSFNSARSNMSTLDFNNKNVFTSQKSSLPSSSFQNNSLKQNQMLETTPVIVKSPFSFIKKDEYLQGISNQQIKNISLDIKNNAKDVNQVNFLSKYKVAVTPQDEPEKPVKLNDIDAKKTVIVVGTAESERDESEGVPYFIVSTPDSLVVLSKIGKYSIYSNRLEENGQVEGQEVEVSRNKKTKPVTTLHSNSLNHLSTKTYGRNISTQTVMTYGRVPIKELKNYQMCDDSGINLRPRLPSPPPPSREAVVKEAENYFLTQENQNLKEELKKIRDCKFSYELVESKPELLRHYLGMRELSVAEIFFELFKDVDVERIKNLGNLYSCSRKFNYQLRIPYKTQILITIMKLRHNFSRLDLSVRFNVSTTGIFYVIICWLHMLHNVLNDISLKRANERIEKDITEESYNFTIGFFDVMTAVPPKLIKNKKIEYEDEEEMKKCKLHRTLRGMIAANPRGIIMFSSDLYPLTYSHQQIFEKCGFLDYLKPGDRLVMSRHISIDNSILPPGVTQAISNITARQTTDSIFRTLKTFDILKYLPFSLIDFQNVVWQTCCYLNNFNKSCREDVIDYYCDVDEECNPLDGTNHIPSVDHQITLS